MNQTKLTVLQFIEGPLETNSYIVFADNGDAALIDPAHISEQILASIKDHGLTIKAILATHSHVDHIYDAVAALDRFNCPLYMHSAAEKLRVFYNHSCELLGFAENEMIRNYTPCEKLQSINFGTASLSITTTPGHSPCGLIFYTEGLMFSGDLLFCGGIGRYDLPHASLPLLYQSLKKLNNFHDDTVVYSGHGLTTSMKKEREGNRYLECIDALKG